MSEQVMQIALIGPDSVLGEVPITSQMGDVGIQRLLQHWRQGIGFHPPTVRVFGGVV